VKGESHVRHFRCYRKDRKRGSGEIAHKGREGACGRARSEAARTIQAEGAESFIADTTHAGAVANAFAGAKAVYAMIPPNIASRDVRAYAESVSDALRSAIEKNGIKYAVVLSSVRADKSHGTGPVVGLHSLEKKLEGVPALNALFLRAGYFMENLLPQVGVIRSIGNMAGPVKEDLTLPMIATRDIGTFAAESLLRLNFVGKSTRELQGSRDITYTGVGRS
jgi:hypothetical protein